MPGDLAVPSRDAGTGRLSPRTCEFMGPSFDRLWSVVRHDGAGGEGINYVVPGAYYFTAAMRREFSVPQPRQPETLWARTG